MKATGIVRRIDELGRVVVPKEIRRTLRIREGDPLEIYTDREGGIILRKYSHLGELEQYAKEYAEALSFVSSAGALICDKDVFIASAGPGKKEYQGKGVSTQLNALLEVRHPSILTGSNCVPLINDKENQACIYQCVAPIIVSGDVMGGVVIFSKDEQQQLSDAERKLAEAGARFLASQME